MDFGLCKEIALLFLCSSLSVLGLPLKFQEGTLLRDSEIESCLETFLEPALKALGHKKEISLHLVCSDVVNAFATGDRSIYLTTGILMHSHCAEELLAILLHELGHIEGHHSITRIEAMRNATYEGLVPLLIGLAVAGLTREFDALGLGATLKDLCTANSFTGFTRGQESMADQFALKMLDKLNWPISGFSDVMRRFAQKEKSFVKDIPRYLQTHPFSQERLTSAEHYLKSLKGTGQLPQHFSLLFDTIKIKVISFSSALKQALNCVENAPVSASLKDYGKAIVYYRLGKTDEALKHLSQFSKESSHSFVQELKSQILFEDRRLKEALIASNHALKKRPWDPLLCGIKAQILIEMDQPQGRKEAIRTLERVLFSGKIDPQLWYWLGVAYGRQKNLGRMRLCFCEHSLAIRDFKQADFHLTTALRLLKPYDRYYQRAREIESEIKRLKSMGSYPG